jgi:hypothetical protein
MMILTGADPTYPFCRPKLPVNLKATKALESRYHLSYSRSLTR